MGIGIEYLIAAQVLGGIFQGIQKSEELENQAKATAQSGTLAVNQMADKAEQMRKQTALLAGKQKTSFLTSGLALEGTPFNILEDTYNTGLQDLNALQKDIGTTANAYNQQAKNYMNASRSAMVNGIISGVAGGISTAAAGGLLSPATTTTSALQSPLGPMSVFNQGQYVDAISNATYGSSMGSMMSGVYK